MKKNVLSFIGVLLGCLTLFMLSLPAYSINGSSEASSVTLKNLIGIMSKNTDYTVLINYLTNTGLLIIAIIGLQIVALFAVVKSIVENKRGSLVPVITSTVSLVFSVLILAQISSIVNLYNDSSSSSRSSVAMGGGTVLLFVVHLGSFGLCLSQFIVDLVAMKNEKNNEDFNSLYNYKKLYDDGIIAEKEYLSYKQKVLNKK